jgi:hypothetical protein
VRLKGSPCRVSACHCTACQQRTGSAFGVGAYYTHDQVSVDGDSTVYTRIGDSGLLVEFHFCGRCGSTVFWLPAFRPHLFAVALGCIAGEKPAGPDRQAYEEHRLDWVSLNVVGQSAT